MLGSDLARQHCARTVTCPYTGKELLAAPALHPDVALVHVHRADMFGNAQIDGYPFMDVDMVHAAADCRAERGEIVEPEQLRAPPHPDRDPALRRGAVVKQPFGAYPHECYGDTRRMPSTSPTT